MAYFEKFAIFPQPVIKSCIGREWTDNEKKFIDYHSHHTHKNMGNSMSLDHYILKAPEASGFLNFVLEGVNHYVDNIINPKNSVNFYITQSWFNFTKHNQYHHVHEHANSIISGVLYIDADKETDSICFHHPTKYKQISFSTKEINLFNSHTWSFPVKTGDLLLFPSSLTHNVAVKQGNNVRCSLAFNVFVKGYLGEEEELTALYL